MGDSNGHSEEKKEEEKKDEEKEEDRGRQDRARAGQRREGRQAEGGPGGDQGEGDRRGREGLDLQAHPLYKYQMTTSSLAKIQSTPFRDATPPCLEEKKLPPIIGPSPQ